MQRARPLPSPGVTPQFSSAAGVCGSAQPQSCVDKRSGGLKIVLDTARRGAINQDTERRGAINQTGSARVDHHGSLEKRSMLRWMWVFAFLFITGLASVSADEIVRYRLPDWKRKHLHDAAKATKITETLKKLGCEVKKADHNGHIDVTYRCPQWKQLDLKSHDEAHKWEAWFKEFHFQTEHKH